MRALSCLHFPACTFLPALSCLHPLTFYFLPPKLNTLWEKHFLIPWSRGYPAKRILPEPLAAPPGLARIMASAMALSGKGNRRRITRSIEKTKGEQMDLRVLSDQVEGKLSDLFEELRSGIAAREDSRAFGAMIEKRITDNWQRICEELGYSALARARSPHHL